jgi:hypothetical protein
MRCNSKLIAIIPSGGGFRDFTSADCHMFLLHTHIILNTVAYSDFLVPIIHIKKHTLITVK